jgi:ABC-type transport system involved in cytochrome c biogenesis permease component
MKLRRISASTGRFLRILFRANSRIIELVYEPLVVLLSWGLVMKSVGQAGIFLTIFSLAILWHLSYSVQSCFNLLTLEDVWNGCFKETILSPLTISEYVVSKVLATLVRSLLTTAVMLGVAYFLFGYNLFLLKPLEYSAILATLFVISIGVGLAIDGLILLMGREVGFLAWSVNGVVVLLSCPYYPVEVFPAFLRPAAYLAPYFWPFEQMKELVSGGTFSHTSSEFSIIAMFAFLFLGALSFLAALKFTRKSGKLSKL